MSAITVERIGRRSYLIGNTYPIKSAIKSAGGHWDGDRRAWWVGDDAKAHAIAERCGSSAGEVSCSAQTERPAPGLDATVAGRAVYKGRTYYLAARSCYRDERPDAVTTRDGAKFLLYFRDGSKSFWAPCAEVSIAKAYDRPHTIRGLREFAERAKESKERFGGDGMCAECGERRAVTEASDSSGLVAGVCGRCARLSRCELSFA